LVLYFLSATEYYNTQFNFVEHMIRYDAIVEFNWTEKLSVIKLI